jgi:hypothetical protein
MKKNKATTNVSRRQFLKKVGAGAAAGCAFGMLGIPFVRSAQPPDVSLGDSFGRMFRLPPFAPPTDAVREALLELGKAGGIMDANDDLAAGPIALVADPNLSLVNRNNTRHTAGVTFFGQFLDHDVTFDSSSRLGFPSQPINSTNARTPFLDLDSVYASGPSGTPELYDTADPIKLKIESGGQFEDLPRNPSNMAAFIGDPRNDENVILDRIAGRFFVVSQSRGRSGSLGEAVDFER